MADKLPGARAALVDKAGVTTPPFYRYFQALERLQAGTASAADVAEINAQIATINAEIAALPKSSFPTLQVSAPLTSAGLLQNGFAKIGLTVANSVVVNGVALQLSGDAAAPGNTYLYSTGPTGTKGWNALSSMLHQSANVAVTFAADGTATFDLQPLTDSGEGTFKLITRDSYGRLSGTKSGTTSDVPEGTNLYYTDARADARIALQKGQPNGIATLDANSKLDAGQLPALAITETFVVSTQAAMLALAAQQGDVCVRTDLHDSFILTTNDPTVLANWQQLETPVDGVASFNGRTGSVTPASGDYTTTQVTEGSNLYFTAARVLATVLAGLSTATNAVITAADSVLVALGKLQAQITANVVALAGKLTASNNLSDLANNTAAVANLRSGFSHVEVWLSTSKTLTDSAFVTIIFNNITTDAQSEYSTTTGAITIKNAGDYLISSLVGAAGLLDGAVFSISVFVNGVEKKRIGQQRVAVNGTGASGSSLGGSCVLALSANDVVTIRVYVSHTSSPTTDGAGSLDNYLTLYRLD